MSGRVKPGLWFRLKTGIPYILGWMTLPEPVDAEHMRHLGFMEGYLTHSNTICNPTIEQIGLCAETLFCVRRTMRRVDNDGLALLAGKHAEAWTASRNKAIHELNAEAQGGQPVEGAGVH